MRPSIGPSLVGGVLPGKFDLASFPEEQRSFWIGGVEAFEVVNAIEGRFGKKKEFTNHPPFPIGEAGVVS